MKQSQPHDFEALVRRAAQLVNTQQRAIIALDGHSGAGKSTWARHLSTQLKLPVISTDDFFAGGVSVRHDSAETLADICIDRDRLAAVLTRWRAGAMVEYAPFDWVAFNGALADEVRIVPTAPALILEGVYANHPDLRDQLSLAVKIDLDAPERERRLMAREGRLGPWERQWAKAEAWYFSQRSPENSFDLIVSNFAALPRARQQER